MHLEGPAASWGVCAAGDEKVPGVDDGAAGAGRRLSAKRRDEHHREHALRVTLHHEQGFLLQKNM